MVLLLYDPKIVFFVKPFVIAVAKNIYYGPDSRRIYRAGCENCRGLPVDQEMHLGTYSNWILLLTWCTTIIKRCYSVNLYHAGRATWRGWRKCTLAKILIMEITRYRGSRLFKYSLMQINRLTLVPNKIPYTGHGKILAFPCPVWEPFFTRRWFVMFLHCLFRPTVL